MKKVFITGVSTGLGNEMMKEYLDDGYFVYACSRSDINITHHNLRFEKLDISDFDRIPLVMDRIFSEAHEIDAIVLNAGVMDDIKTMSESSMSDIMNVMNINVFANKIILDFFIHKNISIKQVIAISSGASVNAFKGWGSYCLSKASLNMLINLYSKEMKDTHLIALAPGVIQTKLVDKILNNTNDDEFTSIKSLRASDKFTLRQASNNIIDNMEKFQKYESGSFLDIRNII